MKRSTELTRELMAPPPAPIDGAVRVAIRDRLGAGIGPLVERLLPGDDIVVNLPLLRRARACPELLATPPEAFAWKPRFVRRSLGLAIMRSCVAGRFRTPMQAAGPVACEAVAEWERTGWRTFHWEPWFAGLAPGGQASVLAEAVSWATPLWSEFEWRLISHLADLGGVDDQWSCPAPRQVRLKGRSEVRVVLDAGEQVRRVADGATGRWPWSRCPGVARAPGGPKSSPFWLWPPGSVPPLDPCPHGSWECGQTPGPTPRWTSTPVCWRPRPTG